MPVFPTATTVFDSILFRDAFGTSAMREVFSDLSLIARYAEVEIALARAEARCGVIPGDAAEEIAKRTDVAALDFDLLRRETDTVGYPILPLVHQIARQCGGAGRYLHWGATTQDIMDTAVVLQLRAGLEIIEDDIADLRGILADLSKRYRDTPMAGRTHLQQALPVTFGYKTAIWLAMFDRHAERLAQLKPRVLVGQFAGAAGTLASLGDKGFEVQKAFCQELCLDVPVSTWHVARDGLAETVNFLALVTGSLGKIALDIMIMASTEFAEVCEPFVKGRGASSTMPQKRNPISSELMLAAAKGGAPACRPDAGCRGAGPRAGHGPLACGVDGDPGEFCVDRRQPASGQVCARRPDRGREEDGRKSRHQPWVDRRRSRDDGPGAADRPAGSARRRLRCVPPRQRERRYACRSAVSRPAGRKPDRSRDDRSSDVAQQLSRPCA
jgi:3-carboxy-cis,cis-muconate cycloisomerase